MFVHLISSSEYPGKRMYSCNANMPSYGTPSISLHAVAHTSCTRSIAMNPNKQTCSPSPAQCPVQPSQPGQPLSFHPVPLFRSRLPDDPVPFLPFNFSLCALVSSCSAALLHRQIVHLRFDGAHAGGVEPPCHSNDEGAEETHGEHDGLVVFEMAHFEVFVEIGWVSESARGLWA